MKCIKHRKNCECCPCHSLFKGHNVNVNIVVLNCQKCNLCLKCQFSGHKSLGLLFVGVIVIVNFGQVRSSLIVSKCHCHCHCHCHTLTERGKGSNKILKMLPHFNKHRPSHPLLASRGNPHSWPGSCW